MKADILPIEVILILLVELIYGLGYNQLVAFWLEKKLVEVSGTVVIGVAGTLIIPLVYWYGRSMQFWQAAFLIFLCFACSGIPMVIGSTRRTVAAEKDQKKRRPWPSAAAKMRDLVVMEISTLAHEIADKAKEGQLTVSDLPDYVNRLHGVIGMLKSV